MPRFAATQTPQPNGKLLFVGGYADDYVGTVQTFDPATLAWANVKPIALPRSFHAAVALANGQVLIAGGLQGTAPLATAELYDPVANTWTPVAPMAEARSLHAAAVLPNGKVLMALGARGVAAEIGAAQDATRFGARGHRPAGPRSLEDPGCTHTTVSPCPCRPESETLPTSTGGCGAGGTAPAATFFLRR